MATLATELATVTTPSEADGVGLHDQVRMFEYTWDVPATITAIDLPRKYIKQRGRVTAVRAFRRAAGDDGTTTVEIKAVINGAAEGSILSTALTMAQAGGANLVASGGVLNVAHAAYNAPSKGDPGIIMNPGDYLMADVTTVEGGTPAGLSVQVTFIFGA